VRPGRSLIAALAACALLGAACTGEPTASPSPTRLTPTPTRTSPAPTPSPSPDPAFSSSVSALGAARRASMTGVSWHDGCPVGLDDLRELHLAHWGLDGRVHEGVLITHADAAATMVTVFGRLFEARFPIERMEPVDAYGGDDERSMEADNTSAFNCREATGNPGVWSQHAFGRAIDVNPLRNPWVDGDTVLPPQGRPYADRSRGEPGMIHEGDACHRAFAAAGWGWGGAWSSVKDYQHFSATGR
jgi:hypothetical protein